MRCLDKGGDQQDGRLSMGVRANEEESSPCSLLVRWREAFVHGQRGCQVVRRLWKSAWQLLHKGTAERPSGPAAALRAHARAEGGASSQCLYTHVCSSIIHSGLEAEATKVPSRE